MDGLLFCSLDFVAFFLAVLAAYWAVPWRRGRVFVLLAASLAFYASWSRWLALVVLASSTLDYLLARCIDAADRPRHRKALLVVSVAANLALLGYFKYVNFFLDALDASLRSAGWGGVGTLSVLVPLGISFYTFESISYIADVYTRRVRAERDLSAFLLFILFFPHLLLGPIVRASDFLPQVARPKRFSWLKAQAGVQLFLLGVFKKLVIADRLAVCANPVFDDPAKFSTLANWVALLAWAGQVYADFSGYSDMAGGCARMLGYRLPRNFDLPYLSMSVAEFWRRWHISLSTWLRDYLFIPLGGSRGGEWKTARNLMVTMVLCGLWHGAGWGYLLFGATQGAVLFGERRWRAWEGRPRLGGVPGAVLGWAVTFTTLLLCFVIFRAPDVGRAGAMYGRLFVPAAGEGVCAPALGLSLTFALVILGHAVARLRGPCVWRRLPAPVLGAGYAVLLTLALLLAPGAFAPFVYIQF